MGSIYDQLNTSLLDAGVSSSALPSTLHDILSVITDESGGNPYAINDNTTGKSYQFGSYSEAANYVSTNQDHTMAIGLFQLLLNGGMGDQYQATPLELLNPSDQFRIALPELLKNEQKAAAYAEGTPEHFQAVVGNPWMADLPKYGGPGDPSNAAVEATANRLKGVDTVASSNGSFVDGVKNSVQNAKDSFKSWGLNTVLIVGGTLGIVLILVNIAKGGRD